MWVVQPGAILGCPPGLEYLTSVDQLLMKQQIELLESKSLKYNVSVGGTAWGHTRVPAGLRVSDISRPTPGEAADRTTGE